MKHIYFLILVLFSINLSLAQTVTGVISDASGIPLGGVNVIEKGTNNGVVSDFDGKFMININGDSKLIFSSVGFNSKEVAVNNQTIINVTLQEGVSLDEVILVGSRNSKRTATDTAVPVDILDVASIASTTGKVEVSEILQYAAPSFNASKQSGSDGADHIVPASLRGLGPDQTLVLIN